MASDPRFQVQGAPVAGDWFAAQGAPTGGGQFGITDPGQGGLVPGYGEPGNPWNEGRIPAIYGESGGWNGPLVPGGADTAPGHLASGPGVDWNQGPRFGLTDPGQGGRVPTALPPGWGGGLKDNYTGQERPPGVGGQGGAAPPGGQNYQQIVEQLMGGSNDPEKLRQIAPQLAQYGITLSNPNASGDLSKILLPDGTPIRVIGAGEGHAVWTPQPGNWGPGGVPQGGQSGGQSGMSPLGALAGGLDPSAAGRLGYSGGLGLNVDVTQDPSYQFRLQEGQKALERSAAAKGTLLTGGTAKALARYGQDMASTEYGNVYNRALGENNEAYRRLFGEQVNRGNQLMNLSQLGLNATGQQANLGSTYSGQAGNILNSQATNIGGNLTGAGNAAGAATIAQGNAWAQGLQGVGQGANTALQMYYLSKLYGGGGGGGVAGLPGGSAGPF